MLVCWGDAEPEATPAVVAFREATIAVPVANGYYVWLVEDVPESAMDDPADFRWLS